uniref:DUF6729 domain-containing protein n=1 Tax=Knipowitschia caucasica TaxID=637954 RepID=A0AAV2MHV4_KNICA
MLTPCRATLRICLEEAFSAHLAHLSSGTGSSGAGSSGAGRIRVSTEEEKGGMETVEGHTEARTEDTEAGGVGEHTEGLRGDTDAGASAAAPGVRCYQCKQLVEGEHFSQHLLDHHTEETCDSCGAKDILSQLDVAHRSMFPAVLTTHLALDRKCMTFLKPRTSRNSSSYFQAAIEEVHSEEWARQAIRYLSDYESHKNMATFVPSAAAYPPPLPFRPLPLAQWFETITKKLAGGIGGSAAWMTNIGNEFGQVLNSVLTTGEGAGLEELCQGIVTRYKNVGKAEPEVIYVDRDCCSQSGVSSVTKLFHPWRSAVRLDSFHFMRRFNCGLTTEHHPLYGTFCAMLSSCIFEWDLEDVQGLKETNGGEWKSSHSGHEPTEEQLLATITSGNRRDTAGGGHVEWRTYGA